MKKLLVVLSLSLGLYAQAPTPQPQPFISPYGVDQLNLFKTYDRASYLAATGTQAPPFDITKPEKTWYDSTVTGSATYSVFNGSASTPGFTKFTLSQVDAASVNLKGLPTYPQYTVPNSNVNIVCNGQVSGYSGIYQSTLAQAQALAKEINDGSQPVESIGAVATGSPCSYRKVDGSSPVSVFFLGSDNIGLLLRQRYANGVGDPGVWSKSPSGNRVFTPAPLYDGSTSTLAPVPMPNRTLLANEKITLGTAGILSFPQIERTDLASTPVAGGGLTAAQDKTLNLILKILQTIFPGVQ